MNLLLFSKVLIEMISLFTKFEVLDFIHSETMDLVTSSNQTICLYVLIHIMLCEICLSSIHMCVVCYWLYILG